MSKTGGGWFSSFFSHKKCRGLLSGPSCAARARLPWAPLVTPELLSTSGSREQPADISLTGRGNGFYDIGSGAITTTYKAELNRHGLKAFFGNDAAIQPGQLQEVMLHETEVSRLKLRLTETRPKEPWTECRGVQDTPQTLRSANQPEV